MSEVIQRQKSLTVRHGHFVMCRSLCTKTCISAGKVYLCSGASVEAGALKSVREARRGQTGVSNPARREHLPENSGGCIYLRLRCHHGELTLF